jgi:thiamine pyrophosphokinase
MKALLIANGEINNYEKIKQYIKGDETVYCCDGGIRHFEKLSMSPDIIMGDFDSAQESAFAQYIKSGAKIFKYPTEKDNTDTELALIKAIDDGASEITIIGGTGGRFDHTLANAHILLNALKKGVKARLVDELNEIMLIDKETSIIGNTGDIISLIPLTTEAVGVTITGVKYPLYDRTLKIGSSFSISNVMIAEEVKISLKSGLLFVIKAID